MKVALIWHDNLFRQQAWECLGVPLQLPGEKAPYKLVSSGCLVLLLPPPCKLLSLGFDDPQPGSGRLHARHFGSSHAAGTGRDSPDVPNQASSESR